MGTHYTSDQGIDRNNDLDRFDGRANLSVALRPTEKVDLKAEADLAPIIPWPFNSPLVPGNEMRTYVLRTTTLPGTRR